MDTPNVHPHDQLKEFWSRLREMRGSFNEILVDGREKAVALTEELFGSLPASFHFEHPDHQPQWVVMAGLREETDRHPDRTVLVADFEIDGIRQPPMLVALVR